MGAKYYYPIDDLLNQLHSGNITFYDFCRYQQFSCTSCRRSLISASFLSVRMDPLFHRVTSESDRAELWLKSPQLLLSGRLLWQECCQHWRTTHQLCRTRTNTWPIFQAAPPPNNNSQKDIYKRPQKTLRRIQIYPASSWQTFFTSSTSLPFTPSFLIFASDVPNIDNLFISFCAEAIPPQTAKLPANPTINYWYEPSSLSQICPKSLFRSKHLSFRSSPKNQTLDLPPPRGTTPSLSCILDRRPLTRQPILPISSPRCCGVPDRINSHGARGAADPPSHPPPHTLSSSACSSDLMPPSCVLRTRTHTLHHTLDSWTNKAYSMYRSADLIRLLKIRGYGSVRASVWNWNVNVQERA